MSQNIAKTRTESNMPLGLIRDSQACTASAAQNIEQGMTKLYLTIAAFTAAGGILGALLWHCNPARFTIPVDGSTSWPALFAGALVGLSTGVSFGGLFDVVFGGRLDDNEEETGVDIALPEEKLSRAA